MVRKGSISVGIDASNVGIAGSATHLVEILRSVSPAQHGIEEITVWGPDHLIDRIKSRDWLHLRSPSLLTRSLLHRLYWQQCRLTGLAEESYDVLFVPGGLYLGQFRPFVTMMRNMLPFDPQERSRSGVSFDRLRYHLLEWGQKKTFRDAAGTIFLSRASREAFQTRHGCLEGRTAIIPHGVSRRFDHSSVEDSSDLRFTNGGSFRWLYVSPIRLYKHQWNVVRAIQILRGDGYRARLDLAGHSKSKAMKKLRPVVQEADPNNEFITYHGRVPHEKIDELYDRADAFVFASTCETFGQVLTEAMQAGLPIACSDRSAAPEVVQEAGTYFDPEQPYDIADAMRRLMDNDELRREKAKIARRRAETFTWDRCAHDTFSFISELARN